MTGPSFDNIYNLSSQQLEDLEKAEDAMLRADLGTAEDILNNMLSEEPDCIPALNNLAHLMGRHFSDFSKAPGQDAYCNPMLRTPNPTRDHAPVVLNKNSFQNELFVFAKL